MRNLPKIQDASTLINYDIAYSSHRSHDSKNQTKWDNFIKDCCKNDFLLSFYASNYLLQKTSCKVENQEDNCIILG